MDYCVPRHPESRFVQAMNVANEIKKKMILNIPMYLKFSS